MEAKYEGLVWEGPLSDGEESGASIVVIVYIYIEDVE